MKIKTGWLMVLLLVLMVFPSCNRKSPYFEGYHNAWDDKRNWDRYKKNAEYKKGYDKGNEDSTHFNKGYDEARAGKSPNLGLENVEWYKKGYAEGQKDRRMVSPVGKEDELDSGKE